MTDLMQEFLAGHLERMAKISADAAERLRDVSELHSEYLRAPWNYAQDNFAHYLKRKDEIDKEREQRLAE